MAEAKIGAEERERVFLGLSLFNHQRGQSVKKDEEEKMGQADWGSLSENSAANASRAPDVLALRFFNHSRGASNGERAAFAFLPHGFLDLRACRNCSCIGESFLINLAFINLPSNRLVQKNGYLEGV